MGNAAVLLNCRGYSLHRRWNSPQREAIHPEHRKSGTLGLVHPGPPATVLNIFQMLREALVLTLFECAGPTPGLWSPQIRSYSPPTHSHANILFLRLPGADLLWALVPLRTVCPACPLHTPTDSRNCSDSTGKSLTSQCFPGSGKVQLSSASPLWPRAFQ